MIVAYSRKAAYMMYKEILEQRPSWNNKVKMVMTTNNQDCEEMAKLIGTIEIASSELAIKITKIMGYSLVVLIGVIGFINLINSMITSIITRKKELGMLQAIGLTNKQLVQMLNKEAMFYTSFMLIGSLTIGNIIGYSAVQAMRKSGMSYAVYVLPINQMIIMIVCIVLAQFILTYLISKNFNKESLIDRVRYSE